MAWILILFSGLLISFNGCSNNDNSENIECNPFIKSHFDSDEILCISKVLTFFDNYVIAKTNCDSIELAYDKFCDDLNGLPPSEISRNLNDLNSESFINDTLATYSFVKSIWRKISYFGDTSTVKLGGFELNHRGSIILVLKHLKKKYPIYDPYYETVTEMGGITPSLMGGYHRFYKELNFGDPLVRFWTAIHFITIDLDPSFHE